MLKNLIAQFLLYIWVFDADKTTTMIDDEADHCYLYRLTVEGDCLSLVVSEQALILESLFCGQSN